MFNFQERTAVSFRECRWLQRICFIFFGWFFLVDLVFASIFSGPGLKKEAETIPQKCQFFFFYPVDSPKNRCSKPIRSPQKRTLRIPGAGRKWKGGHFGREAGWWVVYPLADDLETVSVFPFFAHFPICQHPLLGWFSWRGWYGWWWSVVIGFCWLVECLM